MAIASVALQCSGGICYHACSMAGVDVKVLKALKERSVIWHKWAANNDLSPYASLSMTAAEIYEADIVYGELAGCRLLVARDDSAGKADFHAALITPRGQCPLAPITGALIWNEASVRP